MNYNEDQMHIELQRRGEAENRFDAWRENKHTREIAETMHSAMKELELSYEAEFGDGAHLWDEISVWDLKETFNL